MKQVKKRKINWKGIFSFISDFEEAYLDTGRKMIYRRAYNPKILSLDDYFPSQIVRVVDRLEKRGFIKTTDTNNGIKMTVTEAGREKAFDLSISEKAKKDRTWDGKWRIVLFDIDETSRSKRKRLQKYLVKLGLKQYQKSVYLTPFDFELEINYLREYLGKNKEIKYGILEKLEDDKDLRDCFGL